ncbi:MAG TPA: dihydrodipicolinate synthase family protein [Candidatus Limnocylindria bacterium]|nr:dihydrodipicolinate synthase family protein [Candidatus Limnocylindria bacterium]
MTAKRGAALYERMSGVFTIFLTPFTAGGEVDLDAAAENVDYLIKAGLNGIVVAGTYGEYVTLTLRERRTLLRAVVRAAAGRVPIVACTAGGSTAEVIDYTRDAEEAGADGAMITPPYGMIEPTEGAIVGHFEAVARATNSALLLYNNPNIHPTLAPELLARLADIDGYVGIKQGATTFAEHAELIALAGDRLRIFCGSDQSMVGSLALGAVGLSSTQSNFIPEIIRDTYRAMTRGDLGTARELFNKWGPFRRFARRAGQPAAAKAAVELLGRRCGTVRAPLVPLAPVQRAELADILRGMGLDVRRP